MGYMPPPASSWLQVEGRPDTLIRAGGKKAPATLVPGSGVHLIPTTEAAGGGAIAVHGGVAEPALSLCHYHPGPIGVGNLRTWLVGRMEKNTLAAVLEVTCATPPADVASGHWSLRFAGTTAGQTDLALNVNDQQRFTLDTQAPITVWYRNRGGGWNPNDNLRGWAKAAVPSSPHKVYGLSYYPTEVAAPGLPAGHRRRIGILNTAGEWVVYTDTSEGSGGSTSLLTVTFPYPYDAVVGQAYYVAALAVDGTPDNGHVVGGSREVGSGDAAVINGAGAGSTFPHLMISKSTPAGLDFTDALAGARAGVEGYDARDTIAGKMTTNIPTVRALGRSSGLLCAGDLTVSGLVGAGAPTVAPAGLNIRLDVSQG